MHYTINSALFARTSVSISKQYFLVGGIIPCTATQHLSSVKLLIILQAAFIVINMFYHTNFGSPLHSSHNIHTYKFGKFYYRMLNECISSHPILKDQFSAHEDLLENVMKMETRRWLNSGIQNCVHTKILIKFQRSQCLHQCNIPENSHLHICYPQNLKSHRTETCSPEYNIHIRHHTHYEKYLGTDCSLKYMTATLLLVSNCTVAFNPLI